MHPLGKSPVVTIESPDLQKPLVLAESGLIVEYLSEHFGEELIPSKWQEGKQGKVGGETEEWMRWKYYMHYAEGSLMGLLVLGLIMMRESLIVLRIRRTSRCWLTKHARTEIRDAPVPFFIRPITRSIYGRVNDGFLSKNFINHFDFLESQLASSSGDFICGPKLTGADILLVFALEGARQGETGMTREKYPKLNAYLDRLLERPAYKRAVQKIKDETGGYSANLRGKD